MTVYVDADGHTKDMINYAREKGLEIIVGGEISEAANG